MQSGRFSNGIYQHAHVLPGELWEIVLENLANGEDVDNVFKVFPQLDYLFHRKKCLWIFDQVLPHIFKHIGHRELLKCRLVSTRWCNVIDTFLENNPSSRPYQNNNTSRRKMPYAEFSYQDLEGDVEDYSVVELDSIDKIHKMTEEMNEHTRNPFIGRKVKFIRHHVDHQPVDVNIIEGENFLHGTKTFLEKFGHHIWDVDLNLGEFYTPNILVAENKFAEIVKCLSYLPNVRSLGIEFEFAEEYLPSEKLADILNKYDTFPTLAHLDTIRILNSLCMEGKNFRKFLKLLCGRNTIQKLEITTASMKHQYHKYFPDLTELVVDMQLVAVDLSRPGLLKDLGLFQNLRKLCITSPIIGKNLNVESLLGYLSKLHVEELEIFPSANDDTVFSQSQRSKKELPLISSLKYLRIFDAPKLNFNFLNALPSLNHLQVTSNSEVEGSFLEKETRRKLNLTDTVRSYLYEELVPEKVNIWKLFPALEMVTVQTYCFKQFLREYGNKCFNTMSWHI